MSAINGMKAAAEPKPISRPCAAANTQKTGAIAATTQPAAVSKVASTMVTKAPRLSISRPSRTAPRPKPSMVVV